MTRPKAPPRAPCPPEAPDVIDHAMQVALQQAAQAAEQGEVPVGAVMLFGGQIIAQAHNQRERATDPLGHAELLVIAAAARHLGRWRLWGATLVVTLEPCAMCAGAVVNARVDHLVMGADDPKAGAVGSVFDIVREARLNHRATVTAGVRAAQSAAVLRGFFAARRKAPI